MPFSTLLIGNESLTVACAEALLDAGNSITALVTRNADVATWGAARGLRVEPQDGGLSARLAGISVDWLLSIANLSVIPAPVLALAGKGAVNFHDGPLPRHAGLNAPVWAILEGEARHGITWHLMSGGVDEGEIVLQAMFDIAPDDTALTLNTRCFEAAVDSFPTLLRALEGGLPDRRVQDLSQRSLHLRAARPPAAGRIDFAQPASQALRLVRALDHGTYWNPLTTAKIMAAGQILSVGSATLAEGRGAPGEILHADSDGITVACTTGALRLVRLTGPDGAPVSPVTLPRNPLPSPDPADAARLTHALAAMASGEGAIHAALLRFHPMEIGCPATDAPDWQSLPLALPATRPALAIALGLARALGQPCATLAFSQGPSAAPGYISAWVPLTLPATGTLAEAEAAFVAALLAAHRCPGFALDLATRDPRLALRMPAAAIAEGAGPLPGTAITFALADAALHYDAARLPLPEAQHLAARLAAFTNAMAAAAPDTPVATLPILPQAEATKVLQSFNATAREHDRALTIPLAFEAQVQRTPNATALVCDGETLSYAALNARANRAAHVLRAMGVGRGTLVGLCCNRSPDMVAGALVIQKAGGAYVPMDPGYPADRLALYAEDSQAPVIVTQNALAQGLTGPAAHLALDTDPRLASAPDTNLEATAQPDDLAYMIYTSGSTGRPKGVMVEHRNVANFFAGMDDRLDTAPGIWLAVTSLSFDISVLELFWTLTRGFTVILTSDENRALVSGGPAQGGSGMAFSLYYWGNDDGAGPKKYEMLLDGARFADAHGFCAVWTPERHFHAFGGPYPNPSVTGAAVAAVTKNIGVRAGSCVAPLHHPARIAEDWAVIDNLTNGRAGLAIASGWHPDDFVLRPENTPPANRKAMLDSIDQLRRLWRGEAVEFPTASGKPFAVVTQPRPVSKEVPLWITTAGNPETWKEAGRLGTNVLTHLLGQSIDEVAQKIGLYHAALREAGHDPAAHTVTLMLHTYLAATRDEAREVAREPMKAYLRSAAALIKQYAWAFPAFKKPQGVANPMEIDLQSLTPEETDAILDFAFQRYFEDSGLFGTVEDALARVESLRAIGVTEIACLIDYGIAPATVMEGLKPLAQVLAQSRAQGPADGDYSIAAQIARHGVTHLQCTPSMARMIAMNAEARAALARVQTLMVGGEALPGAQVADLRRATQARILNMYGPTETTIWSTTEAVGAPEAATSIGTPIANTQTYVLDDAMQPLPIGTPGELWIGGEGVARGYWQRDDLTADRFRPNPFAEGRIYRTGDLVRWREDGRLDFLGRADHQVKLRGYRIELGEIEAALEAQPGVAQAVVMAREDAPGDTRLVAYLTGTAAEPALRAALSALLPEHMRPQHYVTLAAFPLTPNKKVDRKALPKPGIKTADPAPASAPAAVSAAASGPSEGMAAHIAAIWQRTLGVSRIAPSDNFFALGGHSLLAVQVHRELRGLPGAERLTITDIFRHPTLAALAAHLGDTGPAPAVPVSDRAEARTEAMARRRAMRQARGRVDA